MHAPSPPSQIANCWERSGIKYLTYFWPENGNCVIFDEKNTVLDEIYSFVEEAVDVGESVLIHSTDGVSRACFCSAVYFMLKYRWCLTKTLAYLQTKRADLEPKPGFMRQLVALDQSLQRVSRANARGKDDPALRKCSEWDPNLILGGCPPHPPPPSSTTPTWARPTSTSHGPSPPFTPTPTPVQTAWMCLPTRSCWQTRTSTPRPCPRTL